MSGSAIARSSLTQAQIDEVADQCGAPRDWFFKDGEYVRLRELPDQHAARPIERLKQINCVAVELRRRGGEPVGFIGNEAYDPAKSR